MVFWWLIICALLIVFVTLHSRVRNPIEVNRQREAILMRHILSGKYKPLYKVGTYYLGVLWAIEEDNIPLTRQDLLIDNEQVTMNAGNIVKVSGGGNWVLGRRLIEKQEDATGTVIQHAGQLNLRGEDGRTIEIDEIEVIDSDQIIQAVTNLKAEQRVPEVMRRMRVALEELMSGFTVNDITEVGKVTQDPDTNRRRRKVLRVSIPKGVRVRPVDGELELVWREGNERILIHNRDELYEALGRGLEYILNFRLFKLGLAVVNMRIHSILIDPQVQEAIEDKVRNQHRKEAAQTLMAGQDLTFREALTPPGQFGEVVKAQAWRDIIKIAKEAVVEGTENLKKFGRGD